MPIDREGIKELIRPQIAELLAFLEGNILLNDELASTADLAILISHMFREDCAEKYAEVVRDTGMEDDELCGALPGLVAEVCEEVRAREIQ
jgi:hypothetical protein